MWRFLLMDDRGLLILLIADQGLLIFVIFDRGSLIAGRGSRARAPNFRIRG